MNRHEFDIWIKNRLEGIEVPFDEASWNEFEKQLTDAELNRFDQQIREKLDSFSAPAVAGAWNAFENKLDAAENIHNESLDDIVREKLKDTSVANDPDAWYKFLPVLQNFETYRRRLIITKVSEFLLIFAVLFTIFNFHQHGVFTSPLKKELIEKTEKAQPTIPIAKVETITPANEFERNTIVDSKAMSENEDIENSDLNTYSTISHSIVIPNELLAQTTDKISVLNLSSLSVQKERIEPIFSNNSQVDNEYIAELVNDLQSMPSIDSTRNSLVYTQLPIKIPEIGLRGNTPSTTMGNNLILPNLKKVKKIELLAGVGIAGNFDQINTPFDEYYNIEPYQQIKGSATADISFRAKRKRIGLRTGFGFSRKKYNPQPVYELISGDLRSNFRGTSLKSIQFDILSSALHCTYDIVSRPHFSLYAMAGASLNVVANSAYHRQEYEIPVVKGEPMPTDRGETDNSAIADAKSYTAGIFQGGAFADNRFMTVDAGLGIEWKVSERSRLFLNPVYKHMLSTTGFGPNQDNINNLSFRVGIETLL